MAKGLIDARTRKPLSMRQGLALKMEPQPSTIEPGGTNGPKSAAGGDVDRREHQRHLTVMRVAKLVNEDLKIEGLGVVRNVSDGGMMIEAHIAVQLGQVIAVSLLEDRRVLGEIMWKEGGTIGISFDVPVSIEDVLARPDRLGNGQKVRLPRLQVNRPGEASGVNGKVSVEICDISQRGAKLQSDQRFAVGEQILVTRGGQKVRGTVKWRNAGFCGVEFHRLLPVDELLKWLPQD